MLEASTLVIRPKAALQLALSSSWGRIVVIRSSLKIAFKGLGFRVDFGVRNLCTFSWWGSVDISGLCFRVYTLRLS